MKQLCTALFALYLFTSCTRESDKEYCWQGFDPNGYVIPGLEVCDKTAAEVQAQYPQYWFFKADEPKYCWTMEVPGIGTRYARNIPASMMDRMMERMGYSYSKYPCHSFCTWQYLDRIQSKSTGGYAPIRTSRETYMADSCSKLYTGRVIVLRETADSIYTREFWKQDP